MHSSILYHTSLQTLAPTRHHLPISPYYTTYNCHNLTGEVCLWSLLGPTSDQFTSPEFLRVFLSHVVEVKRNLGIQSNAQVIVQHTLFHVATSVQKETKKITFKKTFKKTWNTLHRKSVPIQLITKDDSQPIFVQIRSGIRITGINWTRTWPASSEAS